MQTKLADFIKHTHEGAEADAILRSCVHCGFCTATCPTYQLLGDELDGPRGRIYLIKQVLEGAQPSSKTQLHLDRCLTCRNCETTCPSGVRYGRLVDIGRKVVDERVPRSWPQRLLRSALKQVLPRKAVFSPALRLGQALFPILPPVIRNKVPPRQHAGTWPKRQHARKMLLLDGCVQPAMAPNINAASARVLDALGIQLVIARKAGCCGAIRYHLNDHEAAYEDMRRNIDAWWPYVEGAEPVEAIVMTASGCGVTVKEYGQMLAADPIYGPKAGKISALTRDLSEVLAGLESELKQALASDAQGQPQQRVAYHPPCTLQHGQQLRGTAETVLRAAGFEVALCADSHLCCGSAGTYSVLQPELAYPLRDNKLANLSALQPDVIASANIGCLTHLQSGTALPVKHWIELLDAELAQRSGGGA